jgi:parallel beta-helix repeat protein
MRTRTFGMEALSVLLGILVVPAGDAGDLDPPPGPIGPTMKTLSEVEPRTPVQALPGSITAQHVIIESGSYYLTDSVSGVEGKNGIEIVASGVTLDLRGLELVGVTGSLDGIHAHAGSNISIRNGTVRNWGADGVNASAACNSQAEGLRLANNGAMGLSVGSGSVVRNCTAVGNNAHGIFTGFGCTVSTCTASDNVGSGIATAISATVTGCTIHHCTARGNSGSGIDAGEGSTVSDCTASLNGTNGIHASVGCTVHACTATLNGISGIEVGYRCRVVGNEVSNQLTGAGILVTEGSNNRIEGNHAAGNQTGVLVTGTDNLIIQNSASDNANNYNIATGNHYGQIVSSPGAGFTNSNPWANFAY